MSSGKRRNENCYRIHIFQLPNRETIMDRSSPTAINHTERPKTEEPCERPLASPTSATELEGQKSPVQRTQARERTAPWVRRLCSCFYSPPPKPQAPASPTPVKTLTLVLDLDETLIHSSLKPVPNADFTIRKDQPEKDTYCYISQRPGLSSFLTRLFPIYNLVVYTASQDTYARAIVTQMDVNCVISRLYTREHCQKVEGTWVKDLTLVEADLTRVLLVDVRNM